MVFSGSLVNHGTGKYIVCAIGMQTEIGKIASLLDNTKNRKTPLQKNLDTLSGQLSLLILIICFLVLILQLFVARENILNALMMTVALAPLVLFENRKFFLPMTKLLQHLSAELLLISTRPSSI